MGRNQEMLAIRSVWETDRSGVQQSFPLAAAGYIEVLDLSKRYLPVPANTETGAIQS